MRYNYGERLFCDTLTSTLSSPFRLRLISQSERFLLLYRFGWMDGIICVVVLSLWFVCEKDGERVELRAWELNELRFFLTGFFFILWIFYG